MKNFQLKYYFLFVMVLCLTACDPDEFYEDAGSTDVKTVSVTPEAGSELFYDFSGDASTTVTVAQGSETPFGSAVVKKRINDGPWVDHATLNSFPATFSVSLDDVLDGTGLGIPDVNAGDYAEFAFLLDGEFLNGHTAVPITCSTDVSFAAEDPGAQVFLPDDGEDATVSFDMDINGPASIQDVIVYSAYMDGDRLELATVPAADLPGAISATLGDNLALHGLTIDDLAIGDTFTMTFELESGVSCASTSVFPIPYGCVSTLDGTYTATSTGSSGGPNAAPFDITETVTLTGTGAGGYDVDDISFGMYEQIWQGQEDPGTIVDNCGVITLGPSPDQWDDTVTGSGTVNDDGTITISWSNTYGDFGDVTLTPM